jgi:hypothetical protein
MISNDIERKVVVTAPRMIRAAQITAFRRPIQVDEDAALAGFDQGKLVKLGTTQNHNENNFTSSRPPWEKGCGLLWSAKFPPLLGGT